MAEDIFKCEPDDPNRCSAATRNGQCTNLAVPNGTTCRVHGGASQQKHQERKALRNYQLTKFQAKLERHADSKGIKSLRDEIGILRMMLEERLNRCENETDLLLQSHTISELIVKIERVVKSCHSLEGSMGQHLDKQAILQFAGEVIGVIGNALEGQEDKINEIADGIVAIVSRIGNESSTSDG